MIAIISDNVEKQTLALVYAALVRSVSKNQVTMVSKADICDCTIGIYVLIDPSDELLNNILALNKVKVIIFGLLPEKFKASQNAKVTGRHDRDTNWAKSASAETYNYAESLGYIEYSNISEEVFGFSLSRALERFDFTDEWNNVGYGAVRNDGSIWSVAELLSLPKDKCLSSIKIDKQNIATYSALLEVNTNAICWFNRCVGPIDSPDWHIIEKFIASYSEECLPCLPVLLEIPQSCDSAVTMRLDCDEDIESCRMLWNAYKELNVPLSIAVHTTNLNDEKNHKIVQEMHNYGESILSHTATHAPNWGGSYESALYEAQESARRIAELIHEQVKYAVSPFHQAPAYALKALYDSGYSGCIGGIIRNDPEFLLYSGGALANMDAEFIGHSQQVMLHGDCILKDGDPIRVYKEAYDLAFATKTLFGYLDHPFSERYTYGWQSEGQRISVHKELIDYIKHCSDNVLFLSENDALDFIFDKAQLNVFITNGKLIIDYKEGYSPRQPHLPKIMYKNEIINNSLELS